MNITDLLKILTLKIENTILTPSYIVSNGTNNGFEKLVVDILTEMNNNQFSFEIKLGHHFPDINIKIDNKVYGLEIKSRKNESWSTNGNSVLESITSDNYEDIYIIFGSLNSTQTKYTVLYNNYWKTTCDISVTHSPRFKISMNSENSIFNDKESYNAFRNMNLTEKNIFIQDYFMKNIKNNKWYNPQEIKLKPISYNKLQKFEKEKILSEILIIFPYDLLRRDLTSNKNKSNYEKAFEYMFETYFCYSTSFRDLFTAGGKYQIDGVPFPKIIKKYIDLRDNINLILNNCEYEFYEYCLENWNKETLTSSEININEIYYNILNDIGDMYYKDSINDTSYNTLSELIFNSPVKNYSNKKEIV